MRRVAVVFGLFLAVSVVPISPAQAAPAPTELVAQPVILLVGPTVRVLSGPEARLTSNGVPVPGQFVHFQGWSAFLFCGAFTDANGVARCNPRVNGGIPVPLLLDTMLGGGQYEVSCCGNVDYAFARDEAGLIQIGGTKLLHLPPRVP